MDDLFSRWALPILAVRAGADRGITVGHTLIQKVIYLLDAALGVKTGYSYRLYYYGPYSSDLWTDLRLLSDMNALEIGPSPNGYGYSISLAEPSTYKLVLKEAIGAPTQQVDQIMEVLGGSDSKYLELIATTHFVASDLATRGPEEGDEAIAASVTRLKPHFSLQQAAQALDFLRKQRWIGPL